MRFPAILFLALAVLTIPAAAEGCVPTTSRPEVDTGPTPAGRFYVDNDPCHLCLLSIWIYQESNGMDGLQRWDNVWDDTCGGIERGGIEGDELIY